MKHTEFNLEEHVPTQVHTAFFDPPKQLMTNFSAVNICKLLKLEQTHHVAVGNDRRIKIWGH
jgi:hypothetical protein